MEIFTLLETLEDMLEKSRAVPFSSKCIVDKEEILDIIKEVRIKLPEELKQAKRLKTELYLWLMNMKLQEKPMKRK